MTAPVPKVELEDPGCVACGAAEATSLYRGLRDHMRVNSQAFDVVRCDACGLVRTSPRPTRATIGAYYPTDYVPFTADLEAPPSTARRLAQELRALPYRLRHGRPALPAPPPPGGGRLLEIGSGAGVMLARHRGLGWDVWAIEPSPDAAAQSRRRAGIPDDRVQAVGAEDADYPPEHFDAIVLVHVIEHLHDPVRVLALARAALRPGGRVILRCPNFASLERRAFSRRWMALDVPRHLTHFEPDTLTGVLRSAGLRPVSIRPEFQMFGLPASLARTLGMGDSRRGGRAAFLALYYALMPLGMLALTFDAASMEVVAVAETE